MIALLLSLVLAGELVILGPGVLAPADENVLETVARRRLENGWMLTKEPGNYEVLIGVADCNLLNKSGWIITDDIHTALVVDCEASYHRGQMAERGLLADVNDRELGHKTAWAVLR